MTPKPARRPRTPKLPAIPESEVQRSAIALLRGLGWQIWRRNVGGRTWTDKRGRERYMAFAEPGQSDLWGLTPSTPHAPVPRHAEIEIKRRGEWPTPDQILWLVRMSAFGAVAFWADNTADVERVARHIMEGGRVEFVGTEGQYRLIGGSKS